MRSYFRKGFLLKLGVILALVIFTSNFSSIVRGDAPVVESAGRPIPPDDPRWNWWRDARFGLFIHWGPVSLKGTEISWSRAGERRDRHMVAGGIPTEVYDNLYKSFDPEKFNAKEWVNIAKAAGMRYIVIVAKHHDGFCMFDSKLTDYKITNTPFKRDVCAELAKACHDAGMRFGFYYSPPDWHNPDFFTANHAKYIDYMHGQIRELLTNYEKIDILWFDWDAGPTLQNTPETWGDATLFPMIRKLQPGILVTKRCGVTWGDFNTPEQTIGKFDNKAPWETCMTLCKQWSWKPNDQMKSLKVCLQDLVECAGGDGNLLLDVGPMPDGEIEPRQVNRLKEMGDWLAKYGESIYGTRGGPYKPGPWGASTFKGNTVYLHIFNWDGNNVSLPVLGRKVIKSEAMTGGAVTITQDSSSLTVTLPAESHQDIDTVIKLGLDGPAGDIQPLSTSGTIVKGSDSQGSASNVFQDDPKYGADKAFDNDPQTRWATNSGVKQAWLTLDLAKPTTFSKVCIDEADGYNRIKSFQLQYKDAHEWKTFYQGTEIGNDFETPALTPPITAKEVRLNILDATDGPTISEFKILK